MLIDVLNKIVQIVHFKKDFLFYIFYKLEKWKTISFFLLLCGTNISYVFILESEQETITARRTYQSHKFLSLKQNLLVFKSLY